MAAPTRPLVLIGSALLTAPAIYESLELGVLPAETAAVRFAVAAVVLWIGTSLVGSLVAATSAPHHAPDPEPDASAPLAPRPVGAGTAEPSE